MKYQVFICYSRDDQRFALQLADNLKNLGVSTWIDQQNIPASSDWDLEIDKALQACSAFIIILSPQSVISREVRGELRTALDEEKTIVPLLIKECQIPRQLRLVQHINFIGFDANNDERLTKVINAISENKKEVISEMKNSQEAGDDQIQEISTAKPKISANYLNFAIAVLNLIALPLAWSVNNDIEDFIVFGLPVILFSGIGLMASKTTIKIEAIRIIHSLYILVGGYLVVTSLISTRYLIPASLTLVAVVISVIYLILNRPKKTF